MVIFGVLVLVAIQGIAADRLGEHWLRPATLLATAVFMGAVTGSLANLYRTGGRSKV